MKLPPEMIERAAKTLCNVTENANGAWDATTESMKIMHRDLMRAALEAALSECCIETVEATEGPYGEYGVILTEPEMIGKRVALVLLED